MSEAGIHDKYIDSEAGLDQNIDDVYNDDSQSVNGPEDTDDEIEQPEPFPCPIEECTFASKSGFLEIRSHLPSQHFCKQITDIANLQASITATDTCLDSSSCSFKKLEDSGDLVQHYGLSHCLVDTLFKEWAESLLVVRFGQSYLQHTCPCDDFICDDKDDLMKHLTFGHYYKLVLAEVNTLDLSDPHMKYEPTGEVVMEFKCPLCTEKFGKSEFSDTVDINALVGHIGSVHSLTYYFLLSDKSLSQKERNLKENVSDLEEEPDVKLEVLENEALAVYLSPEEANVNYGVKIEPVEFPYSFDQLAASQPQLAADSSRYRPIWTLMNAGQLKAESSFGFPQIKEKSSSPRRNYQQFYRKENDKWICVACGTRYDSTHGIHYHLNHTTCGFGDKEKIQPKKDFRGFYIREEDKFICLGCGQRYDTIRGVHYHLSNKKCGSEVRNKVGNPYPKQCGEKAKRPSTPKKNYLQFYKKENKICICFGCGTQYQSVHGMHNHLNSTKCGFGDKFKSNPKTSYTQFYRKEDDKLICIACEIQYNSMHGMHYHLNSTKCGFGAKEKVTPKKNYQEFYTKIESSFFCNRCDFKIEYLQGIHRHLRTCCGFNSNTAIEDMSGIADISNGGTADMSNGGIVHKEEELSTSKESEDNFFETNMNYIGHDENL